MYPVSCVKKQTVKTRRKRQGIYPNIVPGGGKEIRVRHS